MTRSKMKDQTSRDDLHRKSIQRRNTKLSEQAATQQHRRYWKRTQSSASQQEERLQKCWTRATGRIGGTPRGGEAVTLQKANPTKWIKPLLHFTKTYVALQISKVLWELLCRAPWKIQIAKLPRRRHKQRLRKMPLTHQSTTVRMGRNGWREEGGSGWTKERGCLGVLVG